MSILPKLQHLPWRQERCCWLALRGGAALDSAVSAMAGGFVKRDGYWIAKFSSPWMPQWEGIYARLSADGATQAAILEGETEPDAQHVNMSFKPLSATQGMAQSLWLARALEEGRVHCYLQPVLNAAGVTIGYESFVRVHALDGAIIAGAAIIDAARLLGIEYTIDRHLHIEAIKTFGEAKADGYLFINFFPGFIQRPEIYLEGLSGTALAHGISGKHLVLDFTRSEASHDMAHLKKVTDYCREKGYAIALDDVESLSGAQRLIAEIRPDFVKLDRQLTGHSRRAEDTGNLKQIVNYSHAAGALVIAEGVEKEEPFNVLRDAGVDLFQGYYFAAPMPASEALKRRAS